MTDPTPCQVGRAAALSQIEHTYDDLDRWRVRSREVEMPEPGSDLHEDAKIWPGFPSDQVARMSLVSGVQHLNLARAAIEHGEAFPIAHPTVLRGALLGAARGVWMLTPDDRHDRQQSALRVIYEAHHRMIQYAEYTAGAFPDEQGPDFSEGLAYLKERRNAVKKLWLEADNLTAAETPTDSKIIELAAGMAFTDSMQRASIPALWKHLSGDAHGLGWPLLTRPSTQRTSAGHRSGDGVRMAEFASGADIWEIARGFRAAYLMLRRGWSLFDQRCEAPGNKSAHP